MAFLDMQASSLHVPTSIMAWAGIVTLLLSTWVLASWYRLRQFKGPFLAHFSHYIIFQGVLSGRQGDFYGEITDKYGNLVRIGPRTLITCNPELVRRMNSARTKYKRSDYYRALRMNPYRDSLFSLVDTKAHDDLKAKMSHGYGGKEVPTLERDIDDQISTFVDLLRHKYAAADKLAPADMASLAQFFTVDVLSKVAYGQEFGNLREDRDVYDYVESTMNLLTLLVFCAELPLFRRIFMNKTVLGMIGPSMKDETGTGKILSVAEEIVDRRFKPDFPDQMDMLGSWKRHGCTKLECESEIPFQIIAGSDTTAHAIRGTLLYLLSSPQIYRRLQEEIDAAVESGVLSEPVKAAEAKKLPYLQGVIYEGLRLTLPATLLVWKQVPSEGDTIDGKFIPGDTQIGIAVRGIMRDPKMFGEDTALFRPERWLNLDPAKQRQMAETTELIFGHGRWGCSGKPVAFLELNKIYIELLRNFEFQLVNPRRPIDFSYNIQVHVEKGMWVKVVDRKATKG